MNTTPKKGGEKCKHQWVEDKTNNLIFCELCFKGIMNYKKQPDAVKGIEGVMEEFKRLRSDYLVATLRGTDEELIKSSKELEAFLLSSLHQIRKEAIEECMGKKKAELQCSCTCENCKYCER